MATITTTTRDVKFTVTGISSVDFSFLHLSEDSTFTEGQYVTVPFDNPISFQLSCGDGLKTIFVRGINEYGLVSNTITASFFVVPDGYGYGYGYGLDLQQPTPIIDVFPVSLTTTEAQVTIAGTKTAGTSVEIRIVDGYSVTVVATVPASSSVDWHTTLDLDIGANDFVAVSILEGCEESTPESFSIIRIQPDPDVLTIEISEPCFQVPINDNTPELSFTILDKNGNPITGITDPVLDGYGEIIVLIDDERLYCGDPQPYPYGYGTSYGGYGPFETTRGVVCEGTYTLRAVGLDSSSGSTTTTTSSSTTTTTFGNKLLHKFALPSPLNAVAFLGNGFTLFPQEIGYLWTGTAVTTSSSSTTFESTSTAALQLIVDSIKVLIDGICLCATNVIWTGLQDGVTNFHYVAIDNIRLDERGFPTGDLVTITNTTGILPRSDAIIVATTTPNFGGTWGALEFGEGLFGA